jgi:hypothetical protein
VPTSILQVSRQIYSEARTVLYRTATCQLWVNHGSTAYGYQLNTNDTIPLAKFKKVAIVIQGICCNMGRNGQKMGSLGHLLSCLVDKLALVFGIQVSRQEKSIFLDLVWGNESEVLKEMTKSLEAWKSELFCRVQAAEHIKHIRKALETRAPGVVLTSNVEGEINGVKTKYLSHEKIRFRLHTTREQGAATFGTSSVSVSLDAVFDPAASL